MYYIYRDGKSYGPYSKSAIIQHATANTFVSKNNEWLTFSSHPDFIDLGSSASAAPPPLGLDQDQDLDALETYVFKHTVFPASDAPMQDVRVRFDSEYVRLFIEASQVHCDLAESCLAKMGNTRWLRREAPDLYAASLLTARFHKVLGSSFRNGESFVWRSTGKEIRERFRKLGPSELQLLKGCLEEGCNILKDSKNRWAAIKAPVVREAPLETLLLLETRIDVAAKILEAFETGAASVILGAVKIRYYLPDQIWSAKGSRQPGGTRLMKYWDSYVPTRSSVGSVYLHRLQEIPCEVLKGLSETDTPQGHPTRLAAQIALLPDQEVGDFAQALKTARWAVVFPSGHHRVQD